MGYQKQGALDLEGCETEPIHHIGALQAPYAMVIWRPEDGVILAMTANLPDLCGKSGQDIDALPIHDLFVGSREDIDKALASLVEAKPIALANGRRVLVRRSLVGAYQAVVIDPHPTESGFGSSFGAVLAFNGLIEEQLAKPVIDLAALAGGLASSFRGISGYDRVMVYEFDADLNGRIIAEDADPALDSRYMGLTFPSSDIPRPARELFLKNRVRPLIDVESATVPLISFRQQNAAAFDIGLVPERAVSPIHLSYLANMGVRATLTIALIVQGKLWGLLTCHHYQSARKLSGGDLSLCRVLCDLLSHALNRVRDQTRLQLTAEVDTLGLRLRAAAHAEREAEDFGTLLKDFETPILDLLGASGALITLGTGDFWLGAAPPPGIATLLARLDIKSNVLMQAGFSTNHIAGHFPDLAGALLPDCAGITLIGNSARMSTMTAWRPAIATAISWAGDPNKRVSATGQLRPRASFERWQEESTDKCMPWTAGHEDMLKVLLNILSEVGWALEKRKAERRALSAREQIERARDELEHASLHDALTDLPNRRFLDKTLAQFAKAGGGADRIAALQIDLDRFKVINDTLGHPAGDMVLVHVADVLRRQRRESDFVARVGGDEFVLIARDDLGEDKLADLAQGIIDTLSRPILIAGEQVSFSASIGIAVTPLVGLMPETFLSRADIALYEAKRNGRARFCFVSDEMEQARIERRKLGEDVLRGFEAHEFELFYQLQFAATDGRITGAEALMRWNHPDLGIIGPKDFMEAAEDIGVIEKLDKFSVHSALEVQRTWAAQGLVVPKISVNISARRLKEMNVCGMLQSHPDMAGRIAFELLETVDLNTLDSVSQWNIQNLQDAGIKLEIDDFGAGHTSILSLVRMQPDRLKIDKDLVLPAPESQTARDVIRSIVSIAKTLNIGVTAEGVETEAHAGLMRDLGCDTLQGYALARPMSAEEICERFIKRKRA